MGGIEDPSAPKEEELELSLEEELLEVSSVIYQGLENVERDWEPPRPFANKICNKITRNFRKCFFLHYNEILLFTCMCLILLYSLLECTKVDFQEENQITPCQSALCSAEIVLCIFSHPFCICNMYCMRVRGDHVLGFV